MATTTLEVLGTGALGTSPSVVMATEFERVLFDCGDGTQRLCTEHGVRLAKLNRIFLTSLQPRSTGGLGGMLLTRADVVAGIGPGSAATTAVLGPPGTCDLVKSFRFFYSRPDASVDVYDAESSAAQGLSNSSDDALAVKPILLGAVGGGDSSGLGAQGKRSRMEAGEEQEVDAGCIRYGIKLHTGGAAGGNSIEWSPPFACSYLVSLPERRGRFLVAKAQQLGVRPGPDFGRLSRGESVKVGDRVVTPDECMELPPPAAATLILACPPVSPDDEEAALTAYLSCLRNALGPLALNGGQEFRLGCVVHVSPPSTQAKAWYASLVSSLFAPCTKHIGVGEGISPSRCLFVASHKLQQNFSQVDPISFALRSDIGASSTPPLRRPWLESPGDVRTRFILAPFRSMGRDDSLVPLPLSLSNKSTLPVFADSPAPLPPSLVFLGTGSAVPSKYRNVSSLLVRTRGSLGSSGVLVDAGEGSLGQLMRVHGSSKSARAEMDAIACVWISHMHADHHLGLLSIVADRAERGKALPLVIIGPKPLGLMLSEYAAALGDGGVFSRTYSFFDCDGQAELWPQGFLERLGVLAIQSVHVEHCNRAYALVLKGAGWSFVYSGDTVPCSALVQAGADCTLLVHEATFEDGMESEAKEKKHSTVSQAIEVARQMRAGQVVLTHFSQRYSKLPPAITKAGNVCMAFDLMEVGFDLSHVVGLVDRLAAALEEAMKAAPSSE